MYTSAQGCGQVRGIKRKKMALWNKSALKEDYVFACVWPGLHVTNYSIDAGMSHLEEVENTANNISFLKNNLISSKGLPFCDILSVESH